MFYSHLKPKHSQLNYTSDCYIYIYNNYILYICVCVNLSGLMIIHKVLLFIGGQEEPTPGKMTLH